MSSTPLAASLARRSAPRGARAVIAACLVAPALSACGDNRYRNPPYYDWDGTTVVGAFNIDQMAGDDPALLDAVDSVRGSDSVVLFYGHDPPNLTRYDAIDGLLTRAEQDGLAILTFADLAAGGPPRAGLCLSFDDTEVEYAHPFGSHTRELDDALAGRIRFVRSISGKPKE